DRRCRPTHVGRRGANQDGARGAARREVTERVVITGASSGIGRALAAEYAQRGAVLGLIARRAELLRELASVLKAPTVLYPIDVRDAAGLARSAEDFRTKFGNVDVVIANAGVSAGTSTEDSGDRAV